jgi:hypothetical protein
MLPEIMLNCCYGLAKTPLNEYAFHFAAMQNAVQTLFRGSSAFNEHKDCKTQQNTFLKGNGQDGAMQGVASTITGGEQTIECLAFKHHSVTESVRQTELNFATVHTVNSSATQTNE